MTKNDLATEIVRKTGMDQQKVKMIVQLTLDGIVNALAKEKRFELRNFGIFDFSGASGVNHNDSAGDRGSSTSVTVASSIQATVDTATGAPQRKWRIGLKCWSWYFGSTREMSEKP